MTESYWAKCIKSCSEEDIHNIVKNAMTNGFCHRLAAETQVHDGAIVNIWFCGQEGLMEIFNSSDV